MQLNCIIALFWPSVNKITHNTPNKYTGILDNKQHPFIELQIN